eukprot:COSAG06_NODE_179_length_20947_cov_53.746882_15_plen_56_part_00
MQAQWNENSESLTYAGKVGVTADDAKTLSTPEKTVGNSQVGNSPVHYGLRVRRRP